MTVFVKDGQLKIEKTSAFYQCARFLGETAVISSHQLV